MNIVPMSPYMLRSIEISVHSEVPLSSVKYKHTYTNTHTHTHTQIAPEANGRALTKIHK